MKWSRPDLTVAGQTAITLAIGTAGGFVFDILGLPAAYLSGSMLAVGVAAILGGNVVLPSPVRTTAFVLLGTVLGSTIDQNTVASLPTWPTSLFLLIVCLGCLVAVVPNYLMRIHHMDRWTAKLCAIPGALSVVVALAADLSADTRRVAIVQTTRLTVLMIFIPVLAGIVAGVEAPVPKSEDTFQWGVVLAILTAGAIGVVIAKLLRFPAPYFVGPLLLSGTLFGSGTVEGQMPSVLFWPALIVVGSSVGARFQGTDWRFISGNFKAGVGSTVLSIAITGVFAFPVAHVLEISVVQVWLAFAPGGLEAMTVLAFSLGVDPAFVAGHQLFRFVLLSVAIPFLFRGSVRSDTET